MQGLQLQRDNNCVELHDKNRLCKRAFKEILMLNAICYLFRVTKGSWNLECCYRCMLEITMSYQQLVLICSDYDKEETDRVL